MNLWLQLVARNPLNCTYGRSFLSNYYLSLRPTDAMYSHSDIQLIEMITINAIFIVLLRDAMWLPYIIIYRPVSQTNGRRKVLIPWSTCPRAVCWQCSAWNFHKHHILTISIYCLLLFWKSTVTDFFILNHLFPSPLVSIGAPLPLVFFSLINFAFDCVFLVIANIFIYIYICIYI